MSKKNVPLPANHAFVIQLRAGTGESEPRHRGRVEHLASGHAAHFAHEHELWDFVDGVLRVVVERSPAEHSEPEP
jgi:hypothetical protein